MPRIPEACPSVFCPYNVSNSGTTGRCKAFQLMYRHLVGYVSRSVSSAVCLLFLSIFSLSSLSSAFAQSANPTLSRTVTDQGEAVIPDVDIVVTSNAQGFQRPATANEEGIFIVPLLASGNYVVDSPSRFNEPQAVGTTVDRHLVNNLPLNSHSFHSIALTVDPVNPQPANANYSTVDGMSANLRVNALERYTGPVLSTQNEVILVVLKTSRTTPDPLRPELGSDLHSVALWLVIIASIISLAFLLIRGLAKDLQDTILVLLRFWEKIRKEEKRLKRLRQLPPGTNHRRPRTDLTESK